MQVICHYLQYYRKTGKHSCAYLQVQMNEFPQSDLFQGEITGSWKCISTMLSRYCWIAFWSFYQFTYSLIMYKNCFWTELSHSIFSICMPRGILICIKYDIFLFILLLFCALGVLPLWTALLRFLATWLLVEFVQWRLGKVISSPSSLFWHQVLSFAVPHYNYRSNQMVLSYRGSPWSPMKVFSPFFPG